jgi:hypothetical protein
VGIALYVGNVSVFKRGKKAFLEIKNMNGSGKKAEKSCEPFPFIGKFLISIGNDGIVSIEKKAQCMFVVNIQIRRNQYNVGLENVDPDQGVFHILDYLKVYIPFGKKFSEKTDIFLVFLQ